MRASSSPRSVRLSEEARTALERAWATRESEEPCGCLFGSLQEDGSLYVTEARPYANMHETRDRGWALDAELIAGLQRRARDSGRPLLGYWHGHLVGPATPGRQDWEGRDPLGPALHLILGRSRDGGMEMRAWWAGRSAFEALPLGSTCPSRLP